MRLPLALACLLTAAPLLAQDSPEELPQVPPAAATPAEQPSLAPEPSVEDKAEPVKIRAKAEVVEEKKAEEKKEEVQAEVKEVKKDAEVKAASAAPAKAVAANLAGANSSANLEWLFLKEAAEDPSDELRAAALEDLRLFAVKNHDSETAPEALALSAGIMAKQGDYKGALVEWLRLYYEYPRAKAAQGRSAFNELAEKRFGRKLKPALAELSSVPEDADKEARLAQLVWNLSGSAAETLYEPAVAEARRFQGRFPAYKDGDRIEWCLAELHAKNQKDAQALLAYRKLLAVYQNSPFRSQAQFAVGGLYSEQFKDYRRAIKAYQELTEQFPESAHVVPALERMAALYSERLKQYDAAVGVYERLIKLFPKTEGAAKAYQAEAKLQRERMDLPEDAVKTYRRLAEEFGGPQAVEALLSAAQVARKDLKNYNLEAELRRKVAEEHPEAKEAPEQLYAVAEIQEDDLKNADKALETYREVAQKFGAHKLGKKAAERAAKLEKKAQ